VFEVTFRKDYPNELPDMMVRPLKGVTSKQTKELMEKLQEQARELIGMQMLYPLAQFLKDWLDEQNTDNLAKQKEAARAKDELEMEKEKEVRKRYFTGLFVLIRFIMIHFDQ
jgi:N-acetylglutamate synthase-like GNAT family acetyltransferase